MRAYNWLLTFFIKTALPRYEDFFALASLVSNSGLSIHITPQKEFVSIPPSRMGTDTIRS